MIKFKITPERLSIAATVPEYMGVVSGNVFYCMTLLPKLAVDHDGNYIVEVVLDNDGDILDLKNLDVANKIMEKITPKRLESLIPQLKEAVKNIVDPLSGRG